MRRPIGKNRSLTLAARLDGLSGDRHGAVAWAGALLLFALNWYVCGKLATIEWLDQMQSIEGSFISLARYAASNWPDLSWFPLWYGGIPWQNSYFPLLPLATAALAGISHLSAPHSFHVLCAVLYALGPVTLFWWAARLSGSAGAGFFVGLLYSLASPSALLIPAIREDLGAALHAQRLHAMVFYGDAPFIASLALVPVALLALEAALRRRRPIGCLLAAAALGAVVLVNWIGAAVLAMTVLAWLLGTRAGPSRWALTAGLAALAYLLLAPLMPPSTVETFRFNAQTIGGNYTLSWRQVLAFAAVATVAGLLHWLFRRHQTPVHVRTSLYLLLFASAATLSPAWAGAALLPQPSRYHLAMEMAVCLSVPFLAQPALARLPRWGGMVAWILAILLIGLQAPRYHRYASGLIRPLDIRTRLEHKTAMWFDRNMHGSRVMAPGSTSFYLNAFTDTPQLGGAAEQGAHNWINRIALYTLYSGQNAGERDAEISVLWLKAFGVHAVAVGGPASGEHYKPFANPRKFEGVLPEAWRDGDDRIYRVPSRTDSLAHVVRRGDLVETPPLHGLDVGQVRRYVAALDDPSLPAARMQWTSRHSARITADLGKDQLFSVQVNYHPGWRAEVNGRRRSVQGDKIGLMWIEPKCEGRCAVDLIYDGGAELRIAQASSLTGLLGCLIWAAIGRARRRRTAHV